jgi:two-component system phosphate regulon sensor histidine kinase PhoR
MKRSIFIKSFSGYLLIIIALTVLVSILSYKAIKDFHLDTLSRDLAHLGSSLRMRVFSFFEDERFDEMDAFVKEFGKSINTRITVVDREGVVLADSDEDPKSMVNHRFRPEIAAAFEGKVGESLRFSNTVKEDMLYVGLPMERNGEIRGVLRVSLYLKGINLFLSRLRSNIFRIVLLITALALVGALFFTYSLSRPIREMTLASRRIASGDFDTRVFLKSRDELRELAQSFNYMTEEIQNLFTELSRQKEELASIVSSIEEGLLALGQDGKIMLSNESFNRIVESERVEGKYYWEAVRKPEFIELIKKVQEKKKNYSEELLFDGKTYLCSAALLPSREEIVVTLHDITKIRELEKIKKDFVVNVSHELRTPLTAIKGYVETLEEEVDEKAGDYLEIIKKHTDRLILIVKDLLLLSELEEKESKLEPEKVDVGSLIENVLAIFEQPLKDKKLKIEIKVLNKIPSVKGDSFKLEQMFLNIIDNAVKYTKKGKITVSLKKENKDLSVEIEDTGIGIPEEHLPRIFERFYVVDKSRSRSLGGTGLGLSIVKHIALQHNGKVDVESTPGKGTKFTVWLPV